MAFIDDLIDVTISISDASINSSSFSRLLLCGAAHSGTTPDDVAFYGSLAEILEAGWVATDAMYKAASIAFSNGANGVYIAIRKVASGSTLETVATTLARANEVGGWYGVCSVDDATSDYEDYATWCDANHKLFGFSTVVTTSTVTSPVASTHTYAFGFATKGTGNDIFVNVACMAKCLGYAAGTETWAYKTLVGINADDYTSAIVTAIKTAKLNYYITVGGRNVTLNGVLVNGEFIDIVRFADWLKNDIQNRVYLVYVNNVKVPYTDEGIALIENAIRASLAEGQSRGGIVQNSYAEDGSLILGYDVTVPLAASCSAEDKAARVLNGCRFEATLSGAVQYVTISGHLTI